MADSTASAGSTTVSVSGLAGVSRALTGEAPEAAQSSVLGEVSAVVDAARQQWPVDTGRSSSGLDVVRSGEVGVVARNPIEYAERVQIRGTGGRLAWTTLVEEPLVESRPALERALARDLEAALQRAADRR